MTIPTTAAPSPSWTSSPPHTSKEEGATNFEEGTFQSTMPGKEEGEISIPISPRPRPTAITHLTQWRNVNLIMSRPAPRELSLNPLTSTHGSMGPHHKKGDRGRRKLYSGLQWIPKFPCSPYEWEHYSLRPMLCSYVDQQRTNWTWVHTHVPPPHYSPLSPQRPLHPAPGRTSHPPPSSLSLSLAQTTSNRAIPIQRLLLLGRLHW